jgi:hypothetical protein
MLTVQRWAERVEEELVPRTERMLFSLSSSGPLTPDAP